MGADLIRVHCATSHTAAGTIVAWKGKTVKNTIKEKFK